MTLQQVSLVSQIIAAAGSIGALIFVGLQVRDSARAVSANTAQAVAEGFSNLYRWQSDNPSALEKLMNLVHTPGGSEFWSERSYMFSKNFQEEVKLAVGRQPHPLARTFGDMAVGRAGPTREAS